MPPILGATGFAARDDVDDRLIILGGALVYSTSVLPPESSSLTSLNGSGALSFRVPWHNDVAATQFEPSGEEIWFHARYRTGSTTTASQLRLGLGRNGTEYITISAQDGTNKITIRVAGVVRATAASAAFSVGNWARLHMHVTGDDAGEFVHVYLAGDLSTPVVSYTLIGADATALSGIGKPNEFSVVAVNTAGQYFDDLIAFDPLDVDFPGIEHFSSCSIGEAAFTGNGAETGFTGSYTEIDERPFSDADKITASSIGLESTFTKAAISDPNVFAVKMIARVTRTGTAAGANLSLESKNGGDSEVVTVAAPGDGRVQHIFQKAPDALAWSPVKYDATRFGFVTVT